MKNIFTKKPNINIIKSIAGVFKKLPAFLVYFFYDDKSFIINDTTPVLRHSKAVILNLPKIDHVKACHPELVEGGFLKAFFKRGFLNKRHTFKKMRVVHLNIQNSNTLPFNKHTMRNSTPISPTRKFRR